MLLALAFLGAPAAGVGDDVAPGAAAPAAGTDHDPMPAVETASPAPGANDELDLERTEVTGNRELPKVLYIVPWRKPDPGDLAGRPVNSLLDEVLAPIDREEFLRQVDYYSDLEEQAAEDGGQVAGKASQEREIAQ